LRIFNIENDRCEGARYKIREKSCNPPPKKRPSCALFVEKKRKKQKITE